MSDAFLVALLVGTMAALYIRPFGAQDWQIALAGGLAAWVAGPLGLTGGFEVLRDSTNILAFFLGLMLISAAIQSAGLYVSVARLLAVRAGGPALVATLMAGVLVTAVLSNDATPLILAPAVLAARRAARASLLGVTFVADGASLLLPVSNPVNLLFYERMDIGFGDWTAQILPAALAGTVALCAVHVARSREAVLPLPPLQLEERGARSRGYAAVVLGGSMMLGGAYVAAAIADVPLGLVSLAGGAVLAASSVVSGSSTAREVGRHVSPGLFVFVAGLLLLVDAGEAAGIFGPVVDLLDWVARQPPPVTVLLAALVAAVLSNLMNNWPAGLLISAAIGASADPSPQLVAGALIGCTIGANFTVVGSLSTFFWLSLLKSDDVTFSPAQYARAAFWPTLAGVLAACAVATAMTW